MHSDSTGDKGSPTTGQKPLYPFSAAIADEREVISDAALVASLGNRVKMGSRFSIVMADRKRYLEILFSDEEWELLVATLTYLPGSQQSDYEALPNHVAWCMQDDIFDEGKQVDGPHLIGKLETLSLTDKVVLVQMAEDY